jgi:hypothetical protein
MRQFPAAILILASLPLAAPAQEAARPDWVPEVIEIPEPYEVLMDMKMLGGSSIFSVYVPDDPAPLLPIWQAALEEAGYSFDTVMLADGRLMFEGNGLSAGQVAALPVQDNGEFVIQIDAEVIEQ